MLFSQNLVQLEYGIYVCVSRSVISDSANTWTVAHQAPLVLEFSRQENWSGLPFPSLGDLPDPGIKPVTPALAGGFFNSHQGSPRPP